MSTENKILLGVIGATLAIIVGSALLLGGKPSTSSTSTVDRNILVRADSWKEGTGSAKVTLVEFSDFQCPACKAAQPEVKSTLEKYKGNIEFVYRHFPLPAHQYAFDAAVAAEAAGKQGKFWEMHDQLFVISPDLDRNHLIQAAKDINLNIDQFSADLDSQELRQKVANDETDGNKAIINATPTFFVNGQRFVGFGGIDSAINSGLQK